MPLHNLLALAGLMLGAGALGLQAGLVIPMQMQRGDSMPRALVFFFSFFTILTNLAAVLVYYAALAGWRRLSAPGVRTMIAAYIFVVMVVYHLILAPLWSPQGWWLVADHALHTAAPLLYIAWWLSGPHPRLLRYGRLWLMLLPPLAYGGYALLRGAVSGRYPYPFLDASALGYPAVAINLLGMAAGFALVCAAAIALSRTRHAKAPGRATA